jgi:rhodanese-related sulfurtransferase
MINIFKFIVISMFCCKQLFADVVAVNNNQIKELLKSGVSIIDIRTPVEWKNTGIIPKSNLLTFFDNSGNYNFDKWQKELKKIVSNNDPFVLICRSGRRSGIVANMISKETNAIIYDANGGIKSWINANLKVIKP